jgi:hypothetical protein
MQLCTALTVNHPTNSIQGCIFQSRTDFARRYLSWRPVCSSTYKLSIPWKRLARSRPSVTKVNIPNASTLFPEPPATHPPGIEFIPVRLGRRPFPYADSNKPHINLDDLVAANANYSGGRFVNDDRAGCTVIYGYNSKLPALNEKDWGHFHPDNAESWVILQGLMRYKIGLIACADAFQTSCARPRMPAEAATKGSGGVA